jgi:hypothetical protein
MHVRACKMQECTASARTHQSKAGCSQRGRGQSKRMHFSCVPACMRMQVSHVHPVLRGGGGSCDFCAEHAHIVRAQPDAREAVRSKSRQSKAKQSHATSRKAPQRHGRERTDGRTSGNRTRKPAQSDAVNKCLISCAPSRSESKARAKTCAHSPYGTYGAWCRGGSRRRRRSRPSRTCPRGRGASTARGWLGFQDVNVEIGSVPARSIATEHSAQIVMK